MIRRAPFTTGFTLIETVLSMLAISIGLLGIFGLARHGLKTSGDSDVETRCAILADTVFATLHAKNDELAAKKATLYDWWFYWFRFISGDAQAPLFLPPMLEFADSFKENEQGIRIATGTHSISDYLSAQTPLTEIKWNPTYTLSLECDGLTEGNLSQLSEVYERGTINVTLTIHPGELQSGADKRVYYTTLIYTGGLP